MHLLAQALRHSTVRLRGGSGLGDSVYLRPIVDHLVAQGHQVSVASNYADLFRGAGASVRPFTKGQENVVAHYAHARKRQTTNQYQDVLESAHIRELVPLRFDWMMQNLPLAHEIVERAEHRPIVLVHGGREPFGRTDGLGLEMLPCRGAFLAALSALGGCYTIRIGKGTHFYDVPTNLDLVDKTSVADLIDLTKLCDGVLTQCGFPIPLAECFDKPALVIFGASGLASRHPVIKLITPAKILCKPSSRYVVDDWTEERIRESVSGAFRFV